MKLNHLQTTTALTVIAASALYATPALAAGTQAGDPILNTVTVSYKVGTIDQDDETATNSITVDRKIDVTVAPTDSVQTEVTPGDTSQAVSFQVENTSNDTLDFALSAAQVSGDDFNADTPFTFYLDDGDGIFNGGDTLITHLNALAPDSPVVVHVVADIPTGLSTDDIAGIVLTATAKEANNGAAIGSNLSQATANTSGMDTIFVDGAGDTDGTRDAAFSATDEYIVLAAGLTASKTSTIVAGDYGLGVALPDSTIQYCITVSNSLGSATASSITINDPLPSGTTFDSSYTPVLSTTCDDADATGDTGSHNLGVVSATILSLAEDESISLIFQATID